MSHHGTATTSISGGTSSARIRGASTAVVITVSASADTASHTVSTGAVRSIGGFAPPDAHATGPGRVSTTPATPASSATARTRAIAATRRPSRRSRRMLA